MFRHTHGIHFERLLGLFLVESVYRIIFEHCVGMFGCYYCSSVGGEVGSSTLYDFSGPCSSAHGRSARAASFGASIHAMRGMSMGRRQMSTASQTKLRSRSYSARLLPCAYYTSHPRSRVSHYGIHCQIYAPVASIDLAVVTSFRSTTTMSAINYITFNQDHSFLAVGSLHCLASEFTASILTNYSYD